MSGESTVEGDLPTEKRLEPEKTTIAKLLFAMSGLYERWRNEMENSKESQSESPARPGGRSISGSKGCADESVTAEASAHVNINRFHIPKDPRELLVATILAASVLTNYVLWGKLHDAEKDIQTQVWLRDDALTKFEQGPFADMKAHIYALEIVCKKER